MAQEHKVKRIQVFDSIALGTTEVATQAVADRVIVDTFFSNTLNFVCKYTSGSMASYSTSTSPSTSPSTSISPSISPSVSVSLSPSISTSLSPSGSPSVSASPSKSPSLSSSLSSSISNSASRSPSISSSTSPSISTSKSPSLSPSVSVSTSPSVSQSLSPSLSSSRSPSASPSISVSVSPSLSASSSISPSLSPSKSVSISPSYSPSAAVSTAWIKVWGYTGNKASNTNYPYDATIDTDIAGDTANWVQLGEHTLTGGVAVFTPTIFEIGANYANTAYNAHFSIDICFPKIRFSAYNDPATATKGTLSLTALIQ
jgi:hypothetical protein